ncbi:MAG: T9SS type A sorting domain-containing protein [Calditrichaeota bacterium]|nr:T9SS type A sorting domain-containing protein [Calditrichota bacterium]
MKRYLAVLLFFGTFAGALALPHFRVSPNSLENDIRGQFPTRDTLVINNGEGDEELIWQMEIRIIGEPADSGWIYATVMSGRVAAGRQQISVVRMDGRNLQNGDYYADLFFTSNDPNRSEWTVPAAGHKGTFPRIATNRQVPVQWDFWGFDLNRVHARMYWGETYTTNIQVQNPGSARLVVDSLASQNGYFRFNPAAFQLDPGQSRQVQVIFDAREVGANSTINTSISNAWDPRELNFRIVATVLPVFRLGTPIADLEIDEDAPEVLVADLDSVFVSSYGDTRYDVQVASGFTWRLARNHEFFIRPRPNWNGLSTFYLSAAVGDSLFIADTFAVNVRPVSDAPGPFDLFYPADEETLWIDRYESDRYIGDSLFVWQSAFDPDGDTVFYELKVRAANGDSLVWSALTDTTLSTRELFFNERFNGVVEWSVSASDGMLSRDAWSVFRLMLIEGRQEAPRNLLPGSFAAGLFPNPTNGRTHLSLRLDRSATVRIELYDLTGRRIRIFDEARYSPGEHLLALTLDAEPAGLYILRIEAGADTRLLPLLLLR